LSCSAPSSRFSWAMARHDRPHAGARRSERVPLLASVVVVGLAGASLTWHLQGFVGWSAKAPSTSLGRLRRGSASPPTGTRAAYAWDVDAEVELPTSVEEMIQQGSDAVMRAYRDGNTRQTVRFRLDTMFDLETMQLKGAAGLVNATLPMIKEFTAKLWGGENLKDVQTSFVDEDVGTLNYRVAENAAQDAAVFYLPSRELVVQPKIRGFLDNMKDRLVVWANTENSPSVFKVELDGRDFLEDRVAAYDVVTEFRLQSYYYLEQTFNNWKTTTFRAYPYNWVIYMEDLNFTTIKLMESATKPTDQEMYDKQTEYEEARGIMALTKVAKTLKDSKRMEEVSDQREPGWRAGASAADLARYADEQERGRKMTEENKRKEEVARKKAEDA